MKDKKILMICAAMFLLLSGCEKDPYFMEGNYLYTNSDELKYLENHNGILINWNEEGVTDEQKEVIREIVDNFVMVEGGTFKMGANDSMAPADEKPLHYVKLSDYRISKFTVTQKQWKVIMGQYNYVTWNENYGIGNDYPATQISMSDVQDFLKILNWLSGLHFRLPTEAEWEYAAKGGKNSHGTLYSGSDNPDEVAWHQGNAGNILHQPGLLRPNELGLYDMSGNVWEWCSDWYGEYPSTAQTDPIGPSQGDRRVVRGGSFSYEAPLSRVTQRKSLSPDYQSFVTGFRLAMDEN